MVELGHTVLPGRIQRNIFLQWLWYEGRKSDRHSRPPSGMTMQAPRRPGRSPSQLAAEAVRAAQFFNHTTASSNASVQYVIATAHGYNASGFGTQYCAWHSSTSSSYGNVAYTNLPYITDAGASCGANLNGLGAHAGITIVGGHEMAESITDQFPNGGWLRIQAARRSATSAHGSPPDRARRLTPSSPAAHSLFSRCGAMPSIATREAAYSLIRPTG